jgi:hypothetical protein
MPIPMRKMSPTGPTRGPARRTGPTASSNSRSSPTPRTSRLTARASDGSTGRNPLPRRSAGRRPDHWRRPASGAVGRGPRWPATRPRRPAVDCLRCAADPLNPYPYKPGRGWFRVVVSRRNSGNSGSSIDPGSIALDGAGLGPPPAGEPPRTGPLGPRRGRHDDRARPGHFDRSHDGGQYLRAGSRWVTGRMARRIGDVAGHTGSLHQVAPHTGSLHRVAHSGTFPCLRFGSSSRLVRSRSRLRASTLRVSAGSMTSST